METNRKINNQVLTWRSLVSQREKIDGKRLPPPLIWYVSTFIFCVCYSKNFMSVYGVDLIN